MISFQHQYLLHLILNVKTLCCHKQDYALKVITEANESWIKLMKRGTPAGDLSLV